MKIFALIASAFLFVSCAGYHLGESKPASLEQVRTIAVPMFENSTLLPRAEAIATSAVGAAIIQDGTYRIGDRENSDAVLEGNLSEIKYSIIRGTRLNTLAPQELANTVTLKWVLRDAKNPIKILASGAVTGTSQLFVSDNLQTAKNNALPEALQRAGRALVSRLANGY